MLSPCALYPIDRALRAPLRAWLRDLRVLAAHCGWGR
jgi:hypothetical protein